MAMAMAMDSHNEAFINEMVVFGLLVSTSIDLGCSVMGRCQMSTVIHSAYHLVQSLSFIGE